MVSQLLQQILILLSFARLVIKEQPFPYIYVRSTPGRAAIGAKTQQREVNIKVEIILASSVKINMVGDIDINVKVGQKKSSTMYTVCDMCCSYRPLPRIYEPLQCRSKTTRFAPILSCLSQQEQA